MKKVITGNYAVSYGAMVSRSQVIAAYPITPQTQIVELLSEFCADGLLDAKFIKVESEHSAMASCIGASATGARAFTATSAHGLALMHELLHWAALGRLPIVLANVNRAMGPGWSIWTDQNDSLSQRDTGWLQFYCESNQEILDTIIQGFKISEQILLPTMLVLDAFFLSHTSEPVDIPDIEVVDTYLPKYNATYRLSTENPYAFGGLTGPDHYFEIRYKMQETMDQAIEIARQADEEFERIFGRSHGLIERYYSDDAELILVVSGSIASTTRDVVDQLRSEGRNVGMLKVRMFRPFPRQEFRNAVRRAKKVAVIDRNICVGFGGIFYQEITSTMYGHRDDLPIFGFIAGLGGRDVTPNVIHEIVTHAETHDTPDTEIIWIGVKR
ncbi:MAG: pyruvate ferredoxin oxidoreductase [Gemmatimonadota bacterium]|nr:MAG: pyruvate ferredoxin oxidoreductase [Gemmatimonadota bacterium]